MSYLRKFLMQCVQYNKLTMKPQVKSSLTKCKVS